MESKKIILPLLVSVLVIEIIFFAMWVMYDSSFKDLFFPTSAITQPTPLVETKFSDFDTATELVEDINQSVLQQWQAVPQSLVEELVSSRLYFMLTNKADNHEDLLTQAYVFKDGRFSDPETKDEDKGDQFYSFSADARYGVFTILEGKKRSTPGVGAEVRIFDYSSFGDAAFPVVSETELVDTSSITSKSNPAISNAGEVLFAGWQKSGLPNVEPAEDWTIFRVVDKVAQPLTSGFMPKWVSDTEFIYLADDGVHLSTSDGASDTLIAPSHRQVYNNNRLDVSADGKMIAWMQPEKGIIKILEREGDTFIEKTDLPDKGFWVAFSPSGNYLAAQTIDMYARGVEENPRAKIEFYDLSTFTKVKELVIDLDAFDQQSMFMTDWVTNND